MNDKGNLDYIAAVTKQVREQQLVLTKLVGLMESGLTGLTAAVETGGSAAALSAIESALADVVGAIEKSDPTKGIARAIEALGRLQITAQVNVPEQAAPIVNVNVSPTPITVEAVMPKQAPPQVHFHMPEQAAAAAWEVRIPGQYGAADRVMTITRLNN